MDHHRGRGDIVLPGAQGLQSITGFPWLAQQASTRRGQDHRDRTDLQTAGPHQADHIAEIQRYQHTHQV